MNTLTHSKAIKLINETFWKLERACEHRHEWDQYLLLIDRAERNHRKLKPDFVKCGLTVPQAVKHFAVKQVFERIVPAHPGETKFIPKSEDFFAVRADIFAACAIIEMGHDKITKAFSESDMREYLDSIDYVELNKDRRQLVS